ncbi:MAG: hypothetical protein ABIV39_08105 [Verrucomicrobiota bacterium]
MGSKLHFVLIALLMVLTVDPCQGQTSDQRTLVLVVGAAGESEYSKQFSTSADLWEKAATKGGLQTRVVGTNAENSADDKTLLLKILAEETAIPGGELWLVFIGHGTFDGRSAKFNLRGQDISAEELAAVLKPCHRALAIVNGASASGPYLTALSAPGRVIITATKSGHELNATRFGTYFARAIGDSADDLDKDGQTSLLEAYLVASRQVEQFYKEEGRLATEHSLLDDNGDGLGTPADFFRGVRAVKAPADGKSVDGVRAHQLNLVRSEAERELKPELRGRRDELEQKLSALRDRKSKIKEDDYYRELEVILVEVARLYEKK